MFRRLASGASHRFAGARRRGCGKKRRKVLREQTNTPVILPAPTECSAPKIRGKARARTNARSVGAGQRLGPNLEKLSNTAECFAVEGTVTGEPGRQHWAFGVVNRHAFY